MFPRTTSAQHIQRNYRSLFDQVIQEKTPLVVLNKNKPEVVIVEIHQFEELEEKAQKYEEEMAKQAIQTYQKEKNNKTLKKLSSLADLDND